MSFKKWLVEELQKMCVNRNYVCLVHQYREFSSSKEWSPTPTFCEERCESCDIPLVVPQFEEGFYYKCDYNYNECNKRFCMFSNFNFPHKPDGGKCECGREHECGKKHLYKVNNEDDEDVLYCLEHYQKVNEQLNI